MRRRIVRALVIGAVSLVTLGSLAGIRGEASPNVPGPQTPLANPAMAESCGTDVTLVLDASGSIKSSNAVDDVRDAGEAFLDALADTGSTARVLQFASISQQLAPQSEVTAASLLSGGTFRRAIDGYYSPLPPRPQGVSIYQYKRGDPQSTGSYQSSNSATQYTNWDQSLDQAGDPQPRGTELVLYVTDGDPTAFDFNQAGDPFDHGPPPDVAIATDSDQAKGTTLDRAVQEANRIKVTGARMLAVGVGSAVTGNASSRDRLEQIAGPQVVNDDDLASIDSINDVDVALVRNFDALATFLRGIVNELCTPSLTIRKLAQTPGDASYTPAEGWDISVAPTVAGGSYSWVLPDTDPQQVGACGNPTDPDDQAPRTCSTNDSGIAAFQWEPDPSDAPTSADVSETLQPDYTAGRPDDVDWRCTLKNQDGSQETQEGELDDPQHGFSLDVDPQQIVTCSIFNSFDYEPDIALTKADAPTQVRGDLDPPDNTVTSTFEVTNPGNTPLSQVSVADDHCTPTYQSGDDGDGLLAAVGAETWIYACTRNLESGPGDDPVTVTNHAEASGTDPTGQTVSDTDDADVTVYAPAIELSKLADVAEVEVGVPTDVTYTYVATNTGNMTLTDVSVVDDGGDTPCPDVTPASVAELAPGDSATFTCTITGLNATDPGDAFTNLATVTGSPEFDDGSPAPPDVTADAEAVVTAFQPGLDLVKTVDQSVVLPGTEVTYTYVATNTGTVGLVRPSSNPSPPPPADPRDGWIVDSIGPTGTCADVDYQSGDLDDDQVMDAGESWTFGCQTTISGDHRLVINVAIIRAEVEGTGQPLAALDPAVVRVVQPSIELDKSAVRPTVLDPDAAATAIDGPDTPTPRPAAYLFTVRNTGNVAVRNIAVDDVYPLGGENHCPVEAVPAVGINAGDANENGVLDPGEAWQYECVLDTDPLTKADGDDPPQTTAPSTVTNTAVATGEAFFDDGGTERTSPVETDPVTAEVQVIAPAVQLTKTPCLDGGDGTLTCDPDLLVRPGTDVTYVYEVSNVGDSAFRPVAGFDDRCDVVTFIGGDDNGNGLIDAGADAETWQYRCTTAVGLPSPVLNHAEVSVIGPLGNVYEDTADASVRVFDAAIDLTKSVSDELVPEGSQVTYTFEVRNAGTVSGDTLPADLVLSDITVLDASRPANPGCTLPTFTGGDTNGNHLLDLEPAEVWTYECTGVVDEFTVDLAAVVGRDIQDGLVAAFDGAAVTPFVTGIDIEKTADPTELGVGGGEVTYTYVVTNTGNVPLSGVGARVSDDTCPDVAPVEDDGFNVGDVDHNDLLTSEGDLFETGGREEWQFTCTTEVAVDTVNTVDVAGTPVRPFVDDAGDDQLEVLAADVTASDQAEVTVPAEPAAVLPDDTGLPLLPPTGVQVVDLVVLVALAAVGLGGVTRRLSRRS